MPLDSGLQGVLLSVRFAADRVADVRLCAAGVSPVPPSSPWLYCRFAKEGERVTRNNIMLKRLGAAAFSALLVWSMPGTAAFAEGGAEIAVQAQA